MVCLLGVDVQLDLGEIVGVLKPEYIMQNQKFKLKYHFIFKNLKITHFPLVAGFFRLPYASSGPPSPITFLQVKELIRPCR